MCIRAIRIYFLLNYLKKKELLLFCIMNDYDEWNKAINKPKAIHSTPYRVHLHACSRDSLL